MDYQNTSINQIIYIYPKVGELLNAYGVDCVSCALGTCPLKDIISIHNFPYELGHLVMEQIDKITKNEYVDIKSIQQVKFNKPVFSTPIQSLVDEHVNILRILSLAEYTIKNPNIDVLNNIIYYVKNYADKYHHAKEENILFETTDLNTEIIKTMFAEHDMGRKFIAEAVEAMNKNNIEAAKEPLIGYINLLKEHIKKEDEILYPWFENQISGEQKIKLENDFDEVNKNLDKNLESDLAKFLYDNYA